MQSRVVGSRLNICLLLSVWPHRGVDLGHYNVTELLHSPLIWCWLALTSTVSTRVLLSPIFSTATSVVRGNLVVASGQACPPGGALPRLSGLPSKLQSLQPWEVGVTCRSSVAVDTFQPCLLFLQSLRSGFSFGRGRGFLPREKKVDSIFDVSGGIQALPLPSR